ncbi:MAG: PAS domain-containing protein [Planctomycetota bacterium]|nr:PAS domain-containing protein [Planctomycetota bacterium]
MEKNHQAFLSRSDGSSEVRELLSQNGLGCLAAMTIRVHGEQSGFCGLASTRVQDVSKTVIEVMGTLCRVSRAALEREKDEIKLLRQALVFKNMKEAVIVRDNSHRIIDFNDAATQLFGFRKDEVIGTKQSFSRNVKAENGRDELAESYQSNGKWTGEVECISIDGERRIAETVMVPLRSKHGMLLGRVSISRDVTERKMAETESRHARERLSLALDASHEGIWDWNIVSGSLYVSKRHYTMLGFDPGELKANIITFQDLLHPDEKEKVIRELKREVLKGSERFSTEYRMRTKSGHYRWIFCRGKVVSRDERGRPTRVVGANLDVTERKKTLSALQEKEEQLLHASKMEAIGRLAGGIAHDFNNLMTVIIGQCDLGMMEVDENSRLFERIQDVLKSATSASSLTQQLLAFSRKQNPETKKINLNELISGASSSLPRLLGEHIRFKTIFDPVLNRVLADPNQIQQIILNLVVNARDAMPRGGEIVIETGNVNAPSIMLEDVEKLKNGDQEFVLMSVHDTGVGMDRETVKRAFEPYFTTKEIGKGTGLGLSTVYGTVKQLGGLVDIVSKQGEGTDVRVFLPKHPNDEELTAKINLHAMKTRTVLLVEDDEKVREFIAEILQTHNYRVIQAGGVDEGLELCSDFEDEIELLLTDVVMPERNGFELATEVMRRWPQIRTLFISGYSTEELSKHFNSGSRLELLRKPFTSEILLQKVHNMLERA